MSIERKPMDSLRAGPSDSVHLTIWERCAVADQILIDEISRANHWLAAWGKVMVSIPIANEGRPHVSAAFQHLCLEHHLGILRLVEQEIFGSAFALFRPQFDAFVRGAWIRVCASDAWIGGFLKGENRPSDLRALIEALEHAGAYDHGQLSDFRDRAYAVLCDFTHGGSVQIRSRMKVGAIEQGWEHKHVSGMLKSSSALAYLGLLEMAHLSDCPDELAGALSEAHQKIYVRG